MILFVVFIIVLCFAILLMKAARNERKESVEEFKGEDFNGDEFLGV